MLEKLIEKLYWKRGFYKWGHSFINYIFNNSYINLVFSTDKEQNYNKNQ